MFNMPFLVGWKDTSSQHNFGVWISFLEVNSFPAMKLAAAIFIAVLGHSSAFSAFHGHQLRSVAKSSSQLDMKYKVAVVGGGPAGACAAEIFAQEKGIETVLFERKLDNAKPCGGAIPLCMVGEFDLPER
jgi:geranylgeranyl reductase